MKRPSTLTYTLAVFLLSVAAFGQTRPEAPAPPSITAASTAITGPGFVGADRCQTCHKAESLQFNLTPHAAIKPAKADAATGCEMCHGPGQAHADGQEAAQGDAAKITAASKLIFSFHANPKQNAERCLVCHQSSRDQKDFGHTSHIQHGVACDSCHSMHLVEAGRNPKAEAIGTAQSNFFNVPKLPEQSRWLHNSQLRKPQPELCYQCHGNIQAQFALPTHHRVPEGALKCSDCHNPHGSSNRSELVKSGSETCIQCHVEKRGPFVFEHPASKIEGCVACHTPHGSINRMLLARREERFLCLECHVNPIGDNVPHSRLGFQASGTCTRCHASIHGSNFDVDYLH